MAKKIYIVQFWMGGTINLIPFAAGLLVSSLKKEQDILATYDISEIIFQRDDPIQIVSKMENCAIIAFGCSLWNLGFSLRTAQEVRKKFPEALILFGGSAVPFALDFAEKFLVKYPFIDMICKGEGEELIVDICRKSAFGQDVKNVEGIIYLDKNTTKICSSHYRKEIVMQVLASPYLDGTFDDLWDKYSSKFSGVIMETTRGCPSQCTFCSWGYAPYRILREKPLHQVKCEIEWIGKRKINYVSISDSNFGIRKRDVEIAKMFAECKLKYQAPNYISVSWVKNSSPEVIKVAEILREVGIGYRVTLSIQSTNTTTLKAIKRYNLPLEGIEKVKANYHKARLYCYTELILGLPLETYDSFIEGLEKNIGETIFDQLFIYLLFLLPNTEMGSSEDRLKYGLESKIIVNRHQKNKESKEADEYSEVVIASSTMPAEKWIDAFVESYYLLALHDNRLVFFILQYLKKEYNISFTKFIQFIRQNCREKNFPTIKESIEKMEAWARGVQEQGQSQFVEARGYDGIPYDSSEAIFLELLDKRETFYHEFFIITKVYLQSRGIEYNEKQLEDLCSFQEVIMAHPFGPKTSKIRCNYNWIAYFQFTFNFAEKISPLKQTIILSIIDPKPSHNNYAQFIKNHFNIRGVPAFNHLFDENGKKVFPIITLGRESSLALYAH